MKWEDDLGKLPNGVGPLVPVKRVAALVGAWTSQYQQVPPPLQGALEWREPDAAYLALLVLVT